MNWKKAKLEDCCISITDGDHQPPPKADTGIPFITIANINSYNQIDFDNSMFVPKDYYSNLSSTKRATKDDILYSVVGSFGIPVFIKENIPFVFQRHIALLRPDHEVIIPKFLYYKMLSRDFYRQADTVAIGAAQRTIGLASLRKMVIDFPFSKKEQEKICNVLSTYDDLIENNQKQIKLLEEAALRIYKEWFIDFRFPGHENAKIVDGVPEGWKNGYIKEVIEYHDIKRKPLSSLERSSFKGPYKYYGAAGVLDYVADYLFDGRFLLLGEDGSVITNDGFPVLQYIDGKFWVNNHAHVLTGKKPFTTEYIYMMFKNMKVNDIVTGVAQPKISQERLSNKKVLIPCDNVAISFQNLCKEVFDKIILLDKQIQLLKEARDCLLPKLMNGEIEV